MSGFLSPSELGHNGCPKAVAAVCVREMNAQIQGAALAPWPPGLWFPFRATKPFTDSIVNNHGLG